jgi:hypothetical protein
MNTTHDTNTGDTSDTSTRNTKVTTTIRAAFATLVAALALTLAPTAAYAAGETAAVSPASAPAGSPVSITGSGFQPGETVEVWYGGPVIAGATADANGDFVASGLVPAGMPEGSHPMDVVGAMGSMVSFGYTVDALTPAPTPTPSSGSASPTPAGPTVTTTPSPADQVPAPAGETVDANGVSSESVGAEAAVWLLVIAGLAAIGLSICMVVANRQRQERQAR